MHDVDYLGSRWHYPLIVKDMSSETIAFFYYCLKYIVQMFKMQY